MAAALATAIAAPAAGTDSLPVERLRALIPALKSDPTGPFQGIRWFCPDGSQRPANSPCGAPGGRQQGLPKDEVAALAREHGLYLGQVLAGTDFAAFLDGAAHGARLKQYQLERYLQAVDDGWIMRRARYYRGLFQVESEAAWSREFVGWLLGREDVVASRFFLCRQLLRDLPDRAAGDRVGRIRALASAVAERAPAFADLRNKIHGQPDSTDAGRVAAFLEGGAAAPADSLLRRLLQELRDAQRAPGEERLHGYLRRLPPDSATRAALADLLDRQAASGRVRLEGASQLLWNLRGEIHRQRRAQERQALLDLSVDLEDYVVRDTAAWQPETLEELLAKSRALALAAAGAGFLERWEWQALEPSLEPPSLRRRLTLGELQEIADHTRRAVGWATGMVSAEYRATADLFASFEPLARGFPDEVVRRSVLLPWGQVAAVLADVTARLSGADNQILGLPQAATARGLNPGYAMGTLEVVPGSAEGVAFDERRVYVLERAPADLPPVAGIATVSEGNAVSHVQLLARELGIPNAAVSPELLRALGSSRGETVFYAVSPRGRVILKRAAEMTEEERDLFASRARPEERVAVPTDKLQLENLGLYRLRDLRAVHSGRVCGPKAANLGQLAALFPGRVADGLVIPFGIFRVHLHQPMPGTGGSYWQYLRETFAQAARARQQGSPTEEVDAALLQRLARLRAAVSDIPFLPAFVAQLEGHFAETFGAPMGEVAVFVRSDTNMEDLKEFTGAGLNLTVPNAKDRERLEQAIRDVWASPFGERSYRWRQQFLLNPESVYPSVLLQRAVPVAKSGVLVTTGLVSRHAEDVTVAFSRGAGGAVEGQAAETYLLRGDGVDVLLSPAREPGCSVLPASGGVERRFAAFDQPVLTAEERRQLRQLATEVRTRLPEVPGIESKGPFDVELGFLDGQLWLFQARPFVESRRALSSLYLRGLDPVLPTDVWVPLERRL